MKPTSSSMLAVHADYQQRATHVRSKILKNEEQRMQLDQRLRAMLTRSSRSDHRRQIQHIQTYFSRLNQQSEHAEQRNLNLLNDLTQAQQRLDRLHHDAEHLARLKNDYSAYLEANYPRWQALRSSGASSQLDSSNEYDRLVQHIKRNPLESDGNLRQSVRQSYDVDSSMLFKRYEDQLNGGLDRSMSQSLASGNHDVRGGEHPQPEDPSVSEFHATPPIAPRSKQPGGLRMELSRSGLYFLLDHIEREFHETIDKKKFYHLDPPTITQKRTILDIANEQQQYALKDLDPTTISMVILDQLPSTIRRTTANKCLFTDEILSANIQDLDKDTVAQLLPEQDRSLWLRLIDHFARLLRLHIMNSQSLTNKFALVLLPANVLYAHDKAKSLLKHIVEKLVGTQSTHPEDEHSI